jgi:hypothetical protein
LVTIAATVLVVLVATPEVCGERGRCAVVLHSSNVNDTVVLHSSNVKTNAVDAFSPMSPVLKNALQKDGRSILAWLGLRREGLLAAISLPVAATAALFLGPLVQSYIEGMYCGCMEETLPIDCCSS